MFTYTDMTFFLHVKNLLVNYCIGRGRHKFQNLCQIQLYKLYYKQKVQTKPNQTIVHSPNSIPAIFLKLHKLNIPGILLKSQNQYIYFLKKLKGSLASDKHGKVLIKLKLKPVYGHCQLLLNHDHMMKICHSVK